MHFINAVVIEIYKPIHAYESCMNCIKYINRVAYDSIPIARLVI